MKNRKSTLALVLLVIIGVLAIPTVAFAAPPTVTNEHLRGADGIWDTWDPETGTFSFAAITAGKSRMTMRTGSEKLVSGFEGLQFQLTEFRGDGGHREVYGAAPEAVLSMDSQLTSARIAAPLVVTDEVWTGSQLDDEGNLLPPVSSRTYTILVTAEWIAGDAPLVRGHDHVRDIQPGGAFLMQYAGLQREVSPVATVVGLDDELLVSGAAAYGGMYRGHSHSIEKYDDVAE